MRLDHDRLSLWLERFGRAWKTRDPERAAELFTKDVSYSEAPFEKPLIGTDELRAHWSGLPKAREDISFTSEILASTEVGGIAHWHGSYSREEDGGHVELDGILVISLDDEGMCREFREWTNRREQTAKP
jgi:ketosteroid isomerase-like protein